MESFSSTLLFPRAFTAVASRTTGSCSGWSVPELFEKKGQCVKQKKTVTNRQGRETRWVEAYWIVSIENDSVRGGDFHPAFHLSYKVKFLLGAPLEAPFKGHVSSLASRTRISRLRRACGNSWYSFSAVYARRSVKRRAVCAPAVRVCVLVATRPNYDIIRNEREVLPQNTRRTRSRKYLRENASLGLSATCVSMWQKQSRKCLWALGFDVFCGIRSRAA